MNSRIGRRQDKDWWHWWKTVLAIGNGEVRLLTNREAWSRLSEWRQVYAKVLHKKTGRWILGGLEWHAMSYGYTRHVSGAAAEAHYLKLNCGAPYLVYLEQRSVPMCEVTYGDLPPLKSLYELRTPEGELSDIYLFAADYTWTFVITHEPDIGPFFSRQEWQGQDPAGI